ncbi:MAG TPA: hypothetical protein VGF88_19010 [Acidobacteriaceae bacterium]|jgi:hypothetical protein
MRTTLRGLLFGAIAFVVAAIPTYLISWHLMGLDKLTPEDSPAAVIGAWVCCVRTVAISSIIAIGALLLIVVRGRRKGHSQVNMPD